MAELGAGLTIQNGPFKYNQNTDKHPRGQKLSGNANRVQEIRPQMFPFLPVQPPLPTPTPMSSIVQSFNLNELKLKAISGRRNGNGNVVGSPLNLLDNLRVYDAMVMDEIDQNIVYADKMNLDSMGDVEKWREHQFSSRHSGSIWAPSGFHDTSMKSRSSAGRAPTDDSSMSSMQEPMNTDFNSSQPNNDYFNQHMDRQEYLEKDLKVKKNKATEDLKDLSL